MGAGMRCSLPVLLLTGFLSATLPGRSVVDAGGDTALYRTAPLSGAPWKQVAGIAGPTGSGVYLGKRFILTANHVSDSGTILLNGVEYNRDATFTPVQLVQKEVRFPAGRLVDLKLFRIQTDPGIPGVPLIAPGDNDLAKRCTYVGWGLGRGTAVGATGWMWNDIRVQRWGTNITLPYTLVNSLTGYDVPLLSTNFDRLAGPDEMSLANTDSGGGLFINVNGVWKLAAIGVDTDDNGAFYDHDSAKAGDQPSKSYYVRIRPIRVAILAIINAAAP